MKLTVVTLFPEYFEGIFAYGILGKAREAGIVETELVDLRSFGEGKHRVTDDYPFGGGAGMVMKPGPVVRAVEEVRNRGGAVHVALLTPQGRLFGQGLAQEFCAKRHITLVCGRYEGFDERIRAFCDDEISIGDYVLMGGEAAAAVVVEAVVRLIPGVLGAAESPQQDSLAGGLLEYPQYTRPRVFREQAVPQVLLGGNHGEIAAWRRRQRVIRTAARRPDLLPAADLTEDERQLADRIRGGGEYGD